MDKQITTQDNNETPLSPFHRGEHELQARIGKREKMENIGHRAVRSFMPDQHREFFAQLPFMVVGSVDNNGWPWASILPGKPGFVESPSPTSLNIASAAIQGDPLGESLKETGRPLGFVGIELNTRRRNRVNGRIATSNENNITVNVDQSFGNCPQYIQHRSLNFIREVGEQGQHYEKQTFSTLDHAAKALIKTADTFFVSSFVRSKDQPKIEGVDVSHRGGRPGFIKIEGNTLTIPDYAGNQFFNTLGNFLINPKGGLIFIDFSTGELLMLTGTVELLWGANETLINEETNEEIQAFKGAERAWKFTLDHGIRLKDALPFRANLGEFSPNTLMTGNWEETAKTIAAQAKQEQWQTFKVTKVANESEDIRSFYLEPNDNSALLTFKAGQYLTVKIPSLPDQKAHIRTYTVSSAPDENYYRISVKKENKGIVSNYLHNNLQQGDVIEVKTPRGDFYINALEKRPAVLIGAGVGITPMMSMALHVYNESIRMRQLRPLTVIHAAKTTNSRAFLAEFKQLEQVTNGAIRYLSFISQPLTTEKAGIDFNASGRLSAVIYKQILSLDDYDFFLCGPTAFMQSQYNTLSELGVKDSRIFAEAFGPASIQRTVALTTSAQPNLEAENSVIKFTKSKFEQPWSQGDKTILETAEEHGLTPEFSCRNGKCGSCVTTLLSGEVTYRNQPSASINKNEVLICCAVPAKNSNTIEIDL